ncbi:MAG TPA: hypothetical protein PKO06_19120, partial [Candidatus Ozemobacteraceae bacterium]|nr:hypothetical protein [Candidatus Ozemobacteraceae bacterium]
LSSQATAELTTQAKRIETLEEHLPSAQTTVLPATDAPVSEIFDLTMRLYQKHVIALSLLSVAHCAVFMLLLFLGMFGLHSTGLRPSDLRDLKEVFDSPHAGAAVGFLLWAALSAHCTFASLKAHLIIFLREYVHAGKFAYTALIGEAISWIPSTAWIQGRKYLYLIGWLFLAGLAGRTCEVVLAVGPSASVLRRAFSDLAAMLAAFTVFAYGFLSYTMAEPLQILQSESESVDALTRSRRMTGPWIFKLFLLCAFSMLLVQFITGATQELLLLGTFFSASERFETLIRRATQLVAFLSQICLSPLLIANLVIYSFSLLHQAKHAEKHGT